MTHKLKNLTLAVLTVASVLLAGLSVGGIAAAQEAGNAQLPQEQTFSVDNDTESVRAVAINTSGPLNVSVYAVYDNGTEDLVDSGTLDTSDSTDDAATFAYRIADAETDHDYRVNVSAETDGVTAESVEIEKLQAMSGGGGLLGGAAGGGNLPVYGLVAIVAIAGGGLAWREWA